jgi:hypothetical protein
MYYTIETTESEDPTGRRPVHLHAQMSNRKDGFVVFDFRASRENEADALAAAYHQLQGRDELGNKEGHKP